MHKSVTRRDFLYNIFFLTFSFSWTSRLKFPIFSGTFIFLASIMCYKMRLNGYKLSHYIRLNLVDSCVGFLGVEYDKNRFLKCWGFLSSFLPPGHPLSLHPEITM